MERAEAEAILDGDRETALALLMRIDELIEANRRLEARVAELEQRLSRSSRNSSLPPSADPPSVSYTHLRAHETRHDLVCRLLLEKKKKKKKQKKLIYK